MSHSEFGRVAPQDISAEMSLIGSVLIDKDAMLKVVDMVKASDFYDDRNAKIYQALFDLFQMRKPIDLITVTSVLKDREELELIGGGAALGKMMTQVPTSSHVVQYALIVKAKSTLRSLIVAGQDITALGYNEETEIPELVDSAEKKLFGITHSYIRQNFVHIRDVIETIYDKASEIHESGGDFASRGVATHFRDMDKLLNGFQPSDLVIIAARPSMGKTAFLLNLAQNIAKKGKKSVGIFSLEMAKEQMVERMFCSLLSIDSWKMKQGKLSDSDFTRMWQGIDIMGKLNIFIDDVADASITDIRAKSRRLQMERGLDIIFIDYLQLMRGNNPMNRVQELSEMTRGLKSLARELKVPIVVLSQLSRAVESRTEKEPVLSDLRESGSIEQDADVVMMLYREQYYNRSSDDHTLKILVRKHRNGPTGDVSLGFDLSKQAIYDIEQHYDSGQ